MHVVNIGHRKGEHVKFINIIIAFEFSEVKNGKEIGWCYGRDM